MSDNPDIESLLKNMEVLWDEAFILSKRIIARHVPEDADDRIKSEYASSVPAMANTLYHDLLSASGFMSGAGQKDIQAHIQSTSNFIHELRLRNRAKKMDAE